MSKPKERIAALKLRRTGASVKEIARKLKVGRSTASLWVRDVPLTPTQRKKLHDRMVAGGHAGRLRGAQMNKEKKMNSISHARAAAATSITSLTHRELFMLGLGLYWGEGVKADSSALAIINSDPEIIRIAMRWFADCYSVDRDRFRPRVFINELHRSREKSVLHFWSEKIGLPKKQFSKVVFIKRVNRKVYENHNTYYGVLALRISKGTVLRYRILADIERISGRQYLPV